MHTKDLGILIKTKKKLEKFPLKKSEALPGFVLAWYKYIILSLFFFSSLRGRWENLSTFFRDIKG